MDMESSRGNFKRIRFNVSGTIFETFETTLQRFPTTLLGSTKKRSALYCKVTRQHFINRNRIAFEAILFFYQSFGRLIRPVELSMETFEAECHYFLIPTDMINAMKIKEGYIPMEMEQISIPRNLFERAWQMLEQPNSSRVAYTNGVFSAVMLIISIFVMCAQSMPGVRFGKEKLLERYFWIDFVVSAWFTMEYLTRFAICPDRKKFLKSFMNSIDFLSSLPYLALLVCDRNSPLLFVRVFRMIRLIRMLQLTGSSSRLGMLRSVILSSLGDLGLLFLCLLIVIFIGGSIMYIIEIDSKSTPFTSIPQSFWWAIQTVVVLGYGDIVPTSEVGKLIASFFMIFGALTISLPVLSVVSKLVKIYDNSE